MGCVGFVRRPEANVSPASRKLKSLVMNGSGIGILKRKSRRVPAASIPTVITDKTRRLAKAPNRVSSDQNARELRRPQQSARANVMRTKPSSIRNNETSLSDVGE